MMRGCSEGKMRILVERSDTHDSLCNNRRPEDFVGTVCT